MEQLSGDRSCNGEVSILTHLMARRIDSDIPSNTSLGAVLSLNISVTWSPAFLLLQHRQNDQQRVERPGGKRPPREG